MPGTFDDSTITDVNNEPRIIKDMSWWVQEKSKDKVIIGVKLSGTTPGQTVTPTELDSSSSKDYWVPESQWISRGHSAYFTAQGLNKSTSYSVTFNGSQGYSCKINFTTLGDGSGSGSSGGDPYYYPDGTKGYTSDEDYPDTMIWPIDGTNYVGLDGTQKGIGWVNGTHGYFWAKINGTGHKLIDNNVNNKYTTYDPNHHGSGDYVYIDLEGDCGFSWCSWVAWSVSVLSSNDNNWGSNWWEVYNPWRLTHNLGTNDVQLNDDWQWQLGPEGHALDSPHANNGAGRGRTNSPITQRTLNNQVVAYYCKQNMGDGAWAEYPENNWGWGARHGKGSVAAIKFRVPRLDPLVKVVSSNSEYGSAYFQVATDVDSSDKYIYDSTHYTERYLPIGTHIKLVADVTETGKFIKFSNDINQETSTEVSYEIDITDELVLDRESINFTANFEAGQFEIKVDKNEFITTVSKTPINSQGLHVDWYNVNETITFRAEVFERDDEHFKAYVFDKWEIKYKDGTSTSVIANPFIGTSGVAPLNKSCTVTAIARLVNTSEYRIDCPRYYADGRLCRSAYSSWDDWKQSMVFAPNERIHLRVEDIDSNYRLDHWEQSTDGEIWVELWNNPTKRGHVEAGEYHVFKPIFEVIGSTASILSPDDGLNAITQPVWIDNGKPMETNKRFIGVEDPNGVDWETLFKDDEDKIPKLGDFFFMLKRGGE